MTEQGRTLTEPIIFWKSDVTEEVLDKIQRDAQEFCSNVLQTVGQFDELGVSVPFDEYLKELVRVFYDDIDYDAIDVIKGFRIKLLYLDRDYNFYFYAIKEKGKGLWHMRNVFLQYAVTYEVSRFICDTYFKYESEMENNVFIDDMDLSCLKGANQYMWDWLDNTAEILRIGIKKNEN